MKVLFVGPNHGYVYCTRIGSNKGKTPEHNQAKHTKHPHSLEWHNSTITVVLPSTLRNTLVTHGYVGFPRCTVSMGGLVCHICVETAIVLTYWGFVYVFICMTDVHGAHAWPACTMHDAPRSATATATASACHSVLQVALAKCTVSDDSTPGDMS